MPVALSPVKVADDGTTLSQLGRGALAVTYTTTAGIRLWDIGYAMTPPNDFSRIS